MGKEAKYFLLRQRDLLPAIDGPDILGLLVRDYTHPFDDYTPETNLPNVPETAVQVHVGLQNDKSVRQRHDKLVPSDQPENRTHGLKTRYVEMQNPMAIYNKLIGNFRIMNKIAEWSGTGPSSSRRPIYMIAGFCVFEQANIRLLPLRMEAEMHNEQSPGDSLNNERIARAEGYLRVNPRGGVVFAVGYMEVRNPFHRAVTGRLQPELADKPPPYTEGEFFRGVDTQLGIEQKGKTPEKKNTQSPTSESPEPGSAEALLSGPERKSEVAKLSNIPETIESEPTVAHEAPAFDGTLDNVESYVLNIVDDRSMDLPPITFDVAWEASSFLFDNLVPGTKLANLPVLTGTLWLPQYCTCAEYIQKRWNSLGLRMLTFIDESLKALSFQNEESVSWIRDFEDEKGLIVEVGLVASISHAKFHLRGDSKAIAIIAQSVAWLAAAVRQPNEEQLVYSSVNLSYKDPCFSLELLPLSKPDDNPTKGCWRSLFRHAVVAKTIPDQRPDTEGLELSFELMTIRAGIVEVVRIRGSFVFLGFSTILIPIRKVSNGIQWHLAIRDPRKKSSDLDSILDNEEQVLQMEDMKNLANTTAFLAWESPNVKVLLGTTELNEADNPVTSSPADKMGHQYRIESFTLGGEISFSYKGLGFKATGSTTYKREDLFFNFGVENDFKKLLPMAREESMLLYDAAAKRCWLVPKLSLFLHMAHTHKRLLKSKHALPYAVPNHLGGQAAELALEGRGKTQMEGGHLDSYILSLWVRLTTLEPLFRKPELNDKTIFGFDYIEIARGERTLELRQAQIDKRSAGGWQELRNANSNIWVILGANIEYLQGQDLTAVALLGNLPNPAQEPLLALFSASVEQLIQQAYQTIWSGQINKFNQVQINTFFREPGVWNRPI
ncbi:hypothetical protein CNMCM5623_006838 [Aspergillus felis]|uniref:Uncharacterized protein n=1 Tax=Aspergillus felis TaxID=1287682 RepID=A0A8H6QJH5_9EURO|nr:hypothetical protein CNMCM5623_006838 [Aspergillus felis]